MRFRGFLELHNLHLHLWFDVGDCGVPEPRVLTSSVSSLDMTSAEPEASSLNQNLKPTAPHHWHLLPVQRLGRLLGSQVVSQTFEPEVIIAIHHLSLRFHCGKSEMAKCIKRDDSRIVGIICLDTFDHAQAVLELRFSCFHLWRSNTHSCLGDRKCYFIARVMQKTTKVTFFFAQVRSKPGAETTIMTLDSKNEKHVSRLVENPTSDTSGSENLVFVVSWSFRCDWSC